MTQRKIATPLTAIEKQELTAPITDSPQFVRACVDLIWNHDMTTFTVLKRTELPKDPFDRSGKEQHQFWCNVIAT